MVTALSQWWFVGWVVGVVVILIAALLLIAIILLGRRIARQADDITRALDGTRSNTSPLFDVTHTNLSLDQIARGLRKVRTGGGG